MSLNADPEPLSPDGSTATPPRSLGRTIAKLAAGIVGGFAVIAFGIWALTHLLADRERLFEGHTIDEWRERLTNSSPQSAALARGVVTKLIIPALTNQMFCDTNDSSFKVFMADKLESLPGVQVDFSSSSERRIQAVIALASFGVEARSAGPALIEAVRRPEELLCAHAASALAEIQVDAESAVPALLASIVDSQGNGRPEVVDALGEYGDRAKAAVPKLIGLLQDRSSKEIRFAVPRALKKIDPEAAAKAGVR